MVVPVPPVTVVPPEVICELLAAELPVNAIAVPVNRDEIFMPPADVTFQTEALPLTCMSKKLPTNPEARFMPSAVPLVDQVLAADEPEG